MKKILAIILSFCAICTDALGQGTIRCINRDVKLNSGCAKSEYEIHSSRLRNALAALMNIQSVNKEDLQRQQERWLQYREKACPHKGNSGSFWQSCLARLTQKRANEVEKIVRDK
jgi:uncharacterized protein YecT (DUF1311 family)